MSARPAAVLLDLDGTLIDSREDLTAAVNALLREEGLPELPPERVQGFIGRGARHLIARSLAAAGRPVDAPPVEKVRRWLALYEAGCLDRTRPYPGAVEALDRLAASGVRLAVVTNKPAAITRRILEGLRLSPRFDLVLGGDSLPTRKPSGEPVRHALSVLGASPAGAWMVGDSDVDVVAGREAGVRTLGCLWGIGDREALLAAGPDRLASSWPEAVDVLLR